MNQHAARPRVPRPRITPRPLVRPSVGPRLSTVRRALPLPKPPPPRRSQSSQILPPPPVEDDDADEITGRFHRPALVPREVGAPPPPDVPEVDPAVNALVASLRKQRRRNQALCAVGLLAAALTALWTMTQLLDPDDAARPDPVEAPVRPAL